MLAQASSAGYQYEDAPQTATGKPPSESNLSGGSRSTSGVGSSAGSSSAPGGSKGANADGGTGSKSSKSVDPSGAGNSTGKERSQGEGGSPSNQNAALPIGESAPGTDDGGSSPLLPILIAILVLAGGSVAYLVMKRRRGEGSGSADSNVSPEAS